MSSDTEPSLVTDPVLVKVLEDLKEREPIFHRPETIWERTETGRKIVFHQGTIVQIS